MHFQLVFRVTWTWNSESSKTEMPSNGGYPAVPPRQGGGGDRFYNPPALRRHQQILLQQQQMMQRQLLQQHHQQQQRRMQRRGPAPRPEYSAEAEAQWRNDGDGSSSSVVALYPQRSVAPASTVRVSNLDRFTESVSPYVQARFFPEVYEII